MVWTSLSSSRGYLRTLWTGFISRDCRSHAWVSDLRGREGGREGGGRDRGRGGEGGGREGGGRGEGGGREGGGREEGGRVDPSLVYTTCKELGRYREE